MQANVAATVLCFKPLLSDPATTKYAVTGAAGFAAFSYMLVWAITAGMYNGATPSKTDGSDRDDASCGYADIAGLHYG